MHLVGKLHHRNGLRWRLTALVALAVVFAALTPISRSEAVPPSNRPFFMAGGQCDRNGEPFVRYKVKNTEDVTHKLYISVNGVDVVGPRTLKAGATKGGRFVYELPANPVASVVARWDDGGSNDKSELLFRMSLCNGSGARGPWFIAGQFCKNGKNKVRFTLKNTASVQRHMNVDVSDKHNINEVRLWPNVLTKVMLPGEKITKTRTIPDSFGAGKEVRVRGWWRINDPEAHNRVGFKLHDCS